MFNVKKSRPVGSAQFVTFTIITTICLLLAFLTVDRFFPNALINVFGLLSLSIFIYFTTIRKSDYWGFVLIIFVLAHFTYASNQGGTINFAALLVLLAAIIAGKYQAEKDPLLLVAVGLVLIFNFGGYFFKPTAPFTEVAKGAAAFIAYILMFIFLSSLRFRPDNMGRFLIVLMFVSLYSMAIALNYLWSVYVIDNPIPFLAPEPVRFGSNIVSNMTVNSELYGEESLMLLAFCLPILMSPRHVKRAYKTNWLVITLLLMASLVGLVLSRSRSVFILMILLILCMPFLLNMAGLNPAMTLRKIMIVMALIVGSAYVLWSFINIDYSLERLGEINLSEVTLEGLISGELINRGPMFQYGYDRLRKENWFFGFGWLTYDYNIKNSTGPFSVFNFDLHSLYLTLPLYFGWIGSVAFLSIFFIMLKRLWSIMRRNAMALNGWRIAALCFFLSLLFFLVNEIKIGILREPHYFMTIWIWLGLANALYWSYKKAE